MKVNPLNVLDMRRLNFIPPHFSCMTLELSTFWDERIKKIDQWIYQHLNSRYCIKTVQTLDSERKIVIKYVLGVEESKELTLMTLKCPYLNQEL